MSRQGPENPRVVVLASSQQGSDIPRTCAGQTRAGAPCGSFTMAGADFCYSHNPDISDGERKAAWRLGGLTSTAAPAEAEVSTISLRTRAEVAKARERVYSLTLARVVSSAVASTLLAALKDADAQRDRAEALEIERRGRRPQQHRLTIVTPKWWQDLEPAPRSVPRALPEAKR